MPEMTPQKSQPKNRTRSTLAAGVLVFLLAILCGLQLLGHKNKPVSSQSLAKNEPTALKQDANASFEDVASATKKRTRDTIRSAKGLATATFPHIDSVLTDERISDEEAARQLANIALNPNVSEAERLEAMEHGKNLGFSLLLPLSSDSNLPLPLAESYLHGLHGHNQSKEQVSGALGLMNHSDSGIRQQAQTLIGFLIGAEEDNESPDKLREKAEAFLRQPEGEDGAMNIEH